MRFLGLASLVLATCFMARTSDASFVLIDTFDGTNTGNVNGSWSNAFGSSGTYSTGSVVQTPTGGAGLWLASFSVGLTDFGFNAALDSLRFTGVSTTANSFTASLLDGVSVIASTTGTLMGSDLMFNFNLGGPLVADGVRFTIQGSAATSVGFFSADSLEAVPEPATLALIGVVGMGGGALRWRKRRSAIQA